MAGSGFSRRGAARDRRGAVRLALAAAAAALAAGPGRAARAQGGAPPHVAVTAIVEHPALDACRDGVRAGLAAEGFAEGGPTGLRFTYASAQGQPATAAQIARRLVGDRPAVIVPISTPSAQAVAAATKDLPVVFTAVTDPVGAGLVASLERPGGNVTGVSDLSPIGQHLDLLREAMPGLTRLGVPHNPGEANSATLLRLLREEAARRGIEIVEAAAPRSADVQAAARRLAGASDAIYVPTDNTVVSALEAVIQAGRERRIPVFAGDTDSVRRGAVATVGFDYGQVGRQTAAVVARVLRGERPGDIPVRPAEGTDLVVNPAAGEAFGLTLPPALVARAREVVRS